jgi:ribosome-associated protein
MTAIEQHLPPSPLQIRNQVQAAAAVCEEKKGVDTRILELDPIDSGLADFFLVTSAANDRQAITIADEIEHRLKRDFGAFPNSVEGRRHGQWILLDYVDFVVHVFLADRRAFYDIERLRNSARPLTPAEFDAELKAELAARTAAARQKASATHEPLAVKPNAAAKPRPAAKPTPAVKPKSAVRPRPAARAVSKPKKPAKKALQPAARKSKSAMPAAIRPSAKKKASGKSPAKKAPTRKTAAKKAAARRSVTNKSAPRKSASKKKKR